MTWLLKNGLVDGSFQMLNDIESTNPSNLFGMDIEFNESIGVGLSMISSGGW